MENNEGAPCRSAERPLKPVLVSACLLGLATRYDGLSKPNRYCMQTLEGHHWVPVCPEQLGGLPTPREPVSLAQGDGVMVLAGKQRVLTASGRDVSEYFIRGAWAVLQIAQLVQPGEIYLKAGSPSCGWGLVKGVTACLLDQHGFTIREF